MSLQQHNPTPLALSSAKTCRRLQTLIYDFGLPNKCNAFLPPSLTFRLRKSGLIFNSCRKAANIYDCDVAAFLTIGCSLSSADQRNIKNIDNLIIPLHPPHGLKFFSYKAIELDDIQLRFFFGLGKSLGFTKCISYYMVL